MAKRILMSATAVAGTLLLAACGARTSNDTTSLGGGAATSASTGESTTTTSTNAPTAAPTPIPTPEPTPPPTPPPTPLVHHVGQAIPTTDGSVFTVQQYADHFQSTNMFDKPDPGNFYAAILVRACAPADDTLYVNEWDFSLVLPDDTREQLGFVAGGKQPELNAATLQPGHCIQGWVNFETPAKPKAVVLDNSDLEWVVP